jgi:formamidopyrimidine-DNA glycosylase
VFHFGMTGALFWFPGEPEPLHRHDRIVVKTDRGELRLRDMRKLHGVRLAGDDSDVATILGDAGPDAADVSFDEFEQRIQGEKRQLKTAMTDQSVVAGLGNLLVDEILWRARIHPKRPTAGLSRSDYRRIYRSMGTVLRQSIPTGRVPPRPSWLTGHRDDPVGDCPRCGTTLRRTRIGGRQTAWCPQCQPS